MSKKITLAYHSFIDTLLQSKKTAPNQNHPPPPNPIAMSILSRLTNATAIKTAKQNGFSLQLVGSWWRCTNGEIGWTAATAEDAVQPFAWHTDYQQLSQWAQTAV